MGCNCHGDSRLSVDKVLAFEQCYFCTMKHLTTAWSLWNEFNYQDLNLSAITGQLRLAINHVQYLNKDIATSLRELAIDIEMRNLDIVNNERFEKIITELQKVIYQKYPDMLEKVNRVKGLKR